MLLCVVLGCNTAPAWAHVGSPDIYAEGNAGPYKLFVTVRPPLVIPGVAEIDVRAEGGTDAPAISAIEIAPIPLVGEASKHPPVADKMKQAAGDTQFYSGALWIMACGSWQVRFTVEGGQGVGVLSIPVGLLLVAGVIGIVGAAARDAQLPPGETPSVASRKRALMAMLVTLAILVGAVWLGKVWWDSEADSYAKYVYKPLTMQADVGPDQVLHLKIADPGWLKSRKVDDFVLDHDHLMHLYLIVWPGLDVVFHLHPEQIAPGEFQLALPSIPAGEYRLYADVVHATGFPETLVSSLTLPEISGRPLAGDDAKGTAQAVSSASGIGSCPANAFAQFRLPDGYTMVWNHAATLPAKTPQVFQFTLLGTDGMVASDVGLYMGMLGHAAFVKTDGTVFAHVHPSGTVSMAALMMAAAQNQAGQPQPKHDAMASMPGMPMPGDGKQNTTLPDSVGFPYGFPTAGAYRIFVQMKHGQTIETGVFDACAGTAKAP